jgi:hypothetical protein
MKNPTPARRVGVSIKKLEILCGFAKESALDNDKLWGISRVKRAAKTDSLAVDGSAKMDTLRPSGQHLFQELISFAGQKHGLRPFSPTGDFSIRLSKIDQSVAFQALDFVVHAYRIFHQSAGQFTNGFAGMKTYGKESFKQGEGNSAVGCTPKPGNPEKEIRNAVLG